MHYILLYLISYHVIYYLFHIIILNHIQINQIAYTVYNVRYINIFFNISLCIFTYLYNIIYFIFDI